MAGSLVHPCAAPLREGGRERMPLQAASDEPVPDDPEVLAKLGTVTEEYGYEFVAFP